MTIRAYQEIYLESAMSSMGEAFDYAVNDCGIPGCDFVKMLVGSSLCSKIENGEPAYIVGKSGIEIAQECIFSISGKRLKTEPKAHYKRSPEYWIGWAIAYYQWVSSRKYSEIFKAVSFPDLLSMYLTLHEADVTKFADIIEKRIKEVFPDTNLKRLRLAYGYSQSELAKLSGVNLRSIQMYEQRQKNINKANVDSIYKIAKILGCSIEDLIEK